LQAALWFRKAADQGDALGQANLGKLYADGDGVPQNYPQAAVWWRKAADQGNVLAQVNLGLLYERGRGIPQDYERAHMWFNLAASRAEDAETLNFAVKNRDALAAKMTPAQIAEAQRMAREWVPK